MCVCTSARAQLIYAKYDHLSFSICLPFCLCVSVCVCVCPCNVTLTLTLPLGQCQFVFPLSSSSWLVVGVCSTEQQRDRTMRRAARIVNIHKAVCKFVEVSQLASKRPNTQFVCYRCAYTRAYKWLMCVRLCQRAHSKLDSLVLIYWLWVIDLCVCVLTLVRGLALWCACVIISPLMWNMNGCSWANVFFLYLFWQWLASLKRRRVKYKVHSRVWRTLYQVKYTANAAASNLAA